MVKMIALKSFVYAGKRLKADAEFEARTGSDARLLAAIKNAAEAPEPVAPPPPPLPRTYRRHDLVAEAPATESADEAQATTEKPKRTYKRRDVVAE